MDKLIQWPRAQYWDKPWNPWLGCVPISPACENCYARCATVDRFGQSFEPHRTHKVSPPNSGVVFAGNMTDLFGEWMSVMDSMDCFSRLWHFMDNHSGPIPNDATYLFCTKRVDRMCDALRNYTPIPHAYFGFTAENQEHFLRRGLACADMPEWAKLWVSVEPMLGPVDLLALPSGIRNRIKWIVVGCESGPNRRPCKLKWIEDVVYQCIYPYHKIPVFVKQLDINGKCERDITKFPGNLQIRQVPWAKEDA